MCTDSGSVRAANDKVMIAVPQKGQSVKSLNAPAVTKVQDMQGVRMYGLEARHMCLECQQPMMVPAHYKLAIYMYIVCVRSTSSTDAVIT